MYIYQDNNARIMNDLIIEALKTIQKAIKKT